MGRAHRGGETWKGEPVNELLSWMGEHYFVAWSALWLGWVPYFAILATLRHVTLVVRGWPPEGLDADGDALE
jgi:hypothetical protein